LRNVRGSRPVAPELVEQIRDRYLAIGGSSPLLARTREQAAALAAELDLPVYFGMRNWRPSIPETLAEMKAAGITHVVAVCLAPQYSKMSVGLYFRRLQEAKNELGFDAKVTWTKSFHDHPLIIAAFADLLKPLLPTERVLFTAHSLPTRILAEGDPYDSEARATARLVAEHLGLGDWEFAYQSQGLSGGDWLGPAVESRFDAFAAAGVRDIVLAPIGFVADHVEILYDVDIEFMDYAHNKGITLRRPASLNDSPAFIKALAAVVRQRLETS